MNETAIANHSGDKWFAAATPEAVALSRSVKSVSAIIRFANRHQIPVTPRGAGFGYVGRCVPLKGGIALSTARMKRIKEINENDFVAVVQPGVITADLQAKAEAKGLYYPPDPASRADCSIGGRLPPMPAARAASNTGSPRITSWDWKSFYRAAPWHA